MYSTLYQKPHVSAVYHIDTYQEFNTMAEKSFTWYISLSVICKGTNLVSVNKKDD